MATSIYIYIEIDTIRLVNIITLNIVTIDGSTDNYSAYDILIYGPDVNT